MHKMKGENTLMNAIALLLSVIIVAIVGNVLNDYFTFSLAIVLITAKYTFNVWLKTRRRSLRTDDVNARNDRTAGFKPSGVR